ncbi:lasso peptide biosynthesis B2 protein [Thermomonas sp. S9]|uniref:lasso peptide biosynthesis B2 protein n=1 Tax=Thermomonas sp. S9 TaxID=2885203 RepID=UPI00286FC8B5|nr:lasso peptide biosynthesis B2 protein [Thermomonas sp. S9]
MWRAGGHCPRANAGLFPLLLLMLPLVSLGLSLLGYRRMLALVERVGHRRQRHPATTQELEAARRLAGLLAIAGRRGLPATCLRQALLLHLLLRRRGLAPQLLLGLRRTDGQPAMHAWVELEGTSLDPSPLEHTPFRPTRASDHD